MARLIDTTAPLPTLSAGASDSINDGFACLQDLVARWASLNFSDAKADQPFMGMVEELGELAHARLKMQQGIRRNENHYDAEKDALADIIIFMMHYASLRGIDMGEVMVSTLADVLQRDWRPERNEGRADTPTPLLHDLLTTSSTPEVSTSND